MSATPNQALDALLADVQEVLDLDGSRRCILKGAIVEHLKPFMAGTQSRDTKLMDYLQSLPALSPARQAIGGYIAASTDVRAGIEKFMQNPPKGFV